MAIVQKAHIIKICDEVVNDLVCNYGVFKVPSFQITKKACLEIHMGNLQGFIELPLENLYKDKSDDQIKSVIAYNLGVLCARSQGPHNYKRKVI